MNVQKSNGGLKWEVVYKKYCNFYRVTPTCIKIPFNKICTSGTGELFDCKSKTLGFKAKSRKKVFVPNTMEGTVYIETLLLDISNLV